MLVGGMGRSEQKREHAGAVSFLMFDVNYLALEMLKEAANPAK